MERIYAAIDLKSFFASVECRKRNLDPLTTNLVVADNTRTEKTICLAISPSLKAYGLPGRARLFEVVQKVKNINTKILMNICPYKLIQMYKKSIKRDEYGHKYNYIFSMHMFFVYFWKNIYSSNKKDFKAYYQLHFRRTNNIFNKSCRRNMGLPYRT